MSAFELNVKDKGYPENTVVITLGGFLDNTSSGIFKQRIEILAAEGHKYIILDCGGIEYISSAGWAVIWQQQQALRSSEGCLILTHMSDEMQDIYDFIDFSTMISAHSDIDAALKEISSK